MQQTLTVSQASAASTAAWHTTALRAREIACFMDLGLLPSAEMVAAYRAAFVAEVAAAAAVQAAIAASLAADGFGVAS